MSSGSSSRYQSRLFNFVHQQSRRLTEQWEYTFRHLQVATKWGVEAILYPVYLLFQSSESSGKTLHAREPQTRLKLQPNDTDFLPEIPTVDTPIQHVLDAVQHLSSKETTATPSTTSKPFNPLMFLENLWWKVITYHPTTKASPSQSLTILNNPTGSLNALQSEDVFKHHLPVVQGIATNLLNRSLVLVSTDNEILDILTPQQQAKLEDRIISEVAEYWHSWQLAEAKKETELLPEINRLLAKLAGENTSNIASLPEKTPKELINKSKLLAFLDISIAKLEANALVPVQQRSQEIIQVAQTQLNIFLYGKEQLTAKGEISVTADNLETQTLNFQALIEAVLNYFFGVSNGNKLQPSGSNELPKSLPRQLQTEPWLTLSDLFGDSRTVAQKSVKPDKRTKPALTANPSARLSPPKNLIVQSPKADSGLVQSQKPTRNLTSTQKTSGIASAKQTGGSISQRTSKSHKGEMSQHRQRTQMEAKPDWIETKATLMGYEKHPLEQVLEWFDRAMLWLEEIFARIFQSLQSLWQSK